MASPYNLFTVNPEIYVVEFTDGGLDPPRRARVQAKTPNEAAQALKKDLAPRIVTVYNIVKETNNNER